MQRASALGLKVPEPCFVTILQLADSRDSLEKGEEESFVFHIGHLRVSITPWPEREPHFERISGFCQKAKIWGVVGRKAEHLIEIQDSYLDCKKSIAILQKTFLPPGAYPHEEAVLFSLFRKIAKSGEGQVLVERYWQPLLDLPEENRTLKPVQVIETLVKNGFNAKKSAMDLHVHYNTIRNYISEIQALIESSPRTAVNSDPVTDSPLRPQVETCLPAVSLRPFPSVPVPPLLPGFPPFPCTDVRISTPR